MLTQDQVLNQIRTTLVELFDLPAEKITPQARLFHDLEIDSIDVVDLMEHVRRHTGKKVAAEDFRSVRTVQDLVKVLQHILPETSEADRG